MSFFRSQWSNIGNLLVTRASGVIPPLDCRYYYNFDGVDDVVEIGQRLISDPSNDVFEVGFSLRNPVSTGTFISQNISGVPTNREFQIYTTSSNFTFIFGGVEINTGVPVGNGDFRFVFNANDYEVFKDGISVEASSFVRGSVTEPAATFTIGARHASSLSAYGFYYSGIIYDVYVNSTNFYKIDDNSNTIIDGVSGQNGTLINYTVGQWEYICESESITADTTQVTADDTTHTADEG